MIRNATTNDIPAIKRIADQHKHELGFVNRAALQDAVDRDGLKIAIVNGQIVGFVNFRHRRDNWRVVYELCVSPEHRRHGIARQLVEAIGRPLRLKCPVDLSANRFYERVGLINVWTQEREGKRSLNIWQSQPDVIFCAGNTKRWGKMARDGGMLYGTRHDCKAHWKPYMVDINWKSYNWHGDYLPLIEKYQPTIAMVPDYEHPHQRGAMIAMLRHLVERGVERPMVCPKFDGAINDIPAWALVAISVDSSYAGYEYPIHETRGRRLHLLGGTPARQFKLYADYTGAGAVVSSVDGNSFMKAAQMGTYYESGKWRNSHDRRVSEDDAFKASVANIMKQWRGDLAAQLSMFDAA